MYSDSEKIFISSTEFLVRKYKNKFYNNEQIFAKFDNNAYYIQFQIKYAIQF